MEIETYNRALPPDPALGLHCVSTSTLDDEKHPYCTDCGNADLAYIDQYANGEYWKCKECGKEFIW